ncbi:MAG: hypothetical protein KJ077_11180 [Anaerolineae bacterium]|nr:hypothetical protein [Anaerolineae bacterium]
MFPPDGSKNPLYTGIVRAAVHPKGDEKLIYIYQYGVLTAHPMGAHLVSLGYRVELLAGVDLWQSARVDARSRGYRLVNSDDLKPGDAAWAMVTPDQEPTQCTVIAWRKDVVWLKSKRTHLEYETTCDRVFRDREGCKRYGTCYDPNEAFEDIRQGYVVCLTDGERRPVASVGSRAEYDTALDLLRLFQRMLQRGVGIWRVDFGLASLVEWRV